MTRDDERRRRAAESPIVAGLPDVPGILTALQLTPGLGTHMRGLANELLFDEFAGSTLSRAERELLAPAVSAANDCFYCMDSHGAFAAELLQPGDAVGAEPLVDAIKCGTSGAVSEKMRALLHIARTVQREPRALTRADVEAALAAGATDADTQLAVLIAAAFCMFNRIVDGFRARTPASAEAFRARALQIAEHGYAAPQVTAIPA